MKYTIEITEVLQKKVIVNADNKSKAIEIAKDVYYSGQEVLMPEDLKETTFEIINEKK